MIDPKSSPQPDGGALGKPAASSRHPASEADPSGQRGAEPRPPGSEATATGKAGPTPRPPGSDRGLAPEPSAEPTLLLVDDDEAFRTALGNALARRDFIVSLAANPADAEQQARVRVFEYALVDMRMPGGTGIELVKTLRSIDEGTRVVVLTGYGTIPNAVAAIRAGAVDYLTKPTDADTCRRALLGRTQREGAPEDVPSLDRVEWEYLQRVLSDCGGNLSEAARRLRMHRRSLQRKLARLPPRS